MHPRRPGGGPKPEGSGRMLETGELGQAGAFRIVEGGPRALILVLMAADAAVWVAASAMLASYGF